MRIFHSERSNAENIYTLLYFAGILFKPLPGPTEQYASRPQLSHKAAGQLMYQSFSTIEKTDSAPPLKQ